MMAQRIYAALQDYKGSPAQGRDAARAGFLEWVFSLPGGCNARLEARRALGDLQPCEARSSAADQFVGFLREAQCAQPKAIRRGGAKARRGLLH